MQDVDYTNVQGSYCVKGVQFQRGNVWSEASPSYQNWRPYFFLSGHLKCLIYETPVETEGDLRTRVLAPCKTVRRRQGSLGGCVAAMPAIKSVATTSNSSCEWTENNTPKNITHNVRPIKFYAKETNNLKKSADLRSPWSPMANLPSRHIDADFNICFYFILFYQN
jgi:hypothetical protein